MIILEKELTRMAGGGMPFVIAGLFLCLISHEREAV
jgi:hypothetical protein